MKYILLTILFCYSINSVAQDPNPELFQTWYLYYIQSDDLNTEYEISEIEPPIAPTLTISENFDFNGEGACNLFYGTFETITSTNLETFEFLSETNDCGITVHNFFETSYFDFIRFNGGGWYVITSETNGMVLTIANPLGGIAIFKNYALTVMDFGWNDIQVYPNPSNSEIFISSNYNQVLKIELNNLLGEPVRIPKSSTNSIDISNLAEGIYLLRIFTEKGIAIKKIIKQ
ncbi:T9SS type A sorting domain-containing protein [Aequorivita xiaoshiensis]|uniref:T9SS type A sorting domain-containing protein n=1 Tax=Aequorivita xiaoshiensis TaxID=2874476 RepID=A0A9X1R3N4_9FLAO|nr:T9SS type A sorting domain-containing protein [Aequorivita xiaoshiensis]MCG2432130.1 T9SS type A sorting domain-containing protein [Aequorivita xiaoshiensis]